MCKNFLATVPESRGVKLIGRDTVGKRIISTLDFSETFLKESKWKISKICLECIVIFAGDRYLWA